MKYIEELLQGVEVEWKTLGDEKFIEIANTSRCPVKASNRIAGNTPYYGANNIQDYVEGYTHDGTYVLVAEDGTTSVENYSVQWATGKFWANNHVHVLRGIDCVNSRFLFHYLRIVDFAPFLTGGGRAKLTKKDLIRVPIPIPPLHVQQEIVRILDKFTELETELELRKQQYERYRDQLLAPDKGLAETEVEWKKMREIFETRNGYTPSKANADFWTNGTIPWYRMEDLRTKGRILEDSIQHITPQAIKGKGLFKAGSIILATTATIGEHALLIADSLANQQFTNFSIRKSLADSLIPKFIYYYFFVIDEWCKQNVNVSSFPSVDIERLKSVLFPIPPLHVQQRIVSLLDKFHTLTTSISEGLPRELELRKQQYAYYRDQLLSFER
ncbi:hypothetical protein T235_06535 [Tannerella sp. oral taxon BU063 isolate Cell 8/11]|uniref:Type I restriction modification DNA specificity domain-containing protein n=1 Tax=Tannerella sp. oral taxon BU063 isolate Cell 8/11 TaxID=1411915 RepID=W2D2J7_9BACT|nr:hypothetical protein T235_06535 [Tannerella sp. oral taxon BU063 isolate Cell 8/11]